MISECLLNGANLHQGVRYDSFFAVLKNRDKLDAGHPLKAEGFKTTGYTWSFTAAIDAQKISGITANITGELTPLDTDAGRDRASLLILPIATSSIDFGDFYELPFIWKIRASDGGEFVYQPGLGTFTLIRA